LPILTSSPVIGSLLVMPLKFNQDLLQGKCLHIWWTAGKTRIVQV